MKDHQSTRLVRLPPDEFWKAVEADKLEFRQRVNLAAAEGRGVEEFYASLSLMGIDVTKPERPRLVSINGVRLARR